MMVMMMMMMMMLMMMMAMMLLLLLLLMMMMMIIMMMMMMTTTSIPCRLEAQEYRRLPRLDLMVSRSRKIIRKYIDKGAQTPVALSARTLAHVLRSRHIPGPALLWEAQNEVYDFIERELLPKFRKTSFYRMQVLESVRLGVMLGH
jgi:hypothetical protein